MLLELKNHFTNNKYKAFFHANRNFQKDAVKKWNPHTDQLTRSLFMGFVGLDEGKRKGAGTVVLDLLIKDGTMREVDFGKWLRCK